MNIPRIQPLDLRFVGGGLVQERPGQLIIEAAGNVVMLQSEVGCLRGVDMFTERRPIFFWFVHQYCGLHHYLNT